MQFQLRLFSTFAVVAQSVQRQAVTQQTEASATCPTFSSTYKGSRIVLSNDNTVATSSNGGHSWNTVYGEETVSSGSYTWNVRVDTLANHPSNYWELVIGVAKDTAATSSWLSRYETGYGYIQEIGDKTSPRRRSDHKTYGQTYGAGDEITVSLDLDALTLSFSRNGISEGVAYDSTILTAGTYRLAVSIGDSGDSVNLLCPRAAPAPTPPPPVHGMWTITRGHSDWASLSKTDRVCGLSTDYFTMGHMQSEFCVGKDLGPTAQVVLNQDGKERTWGWFCSSQGTTYIVGSPTFEEEGLDGPCSFQHNVVDDGS
jgi:hypothetical protein